MFQCYPNYTPLIIRSSNLPKTPKTRAFIHICHRIPIWNSAISEQSHYCPNFKRINSLTRLIIPCWGSNHGPPAPQSNMLQIKLTWLDFECQHFTKKVEWFYYQCLPFFKLICVTLINFVPLIKRVSQFLIKGEFFLERERGRERERGTYCLGLASGRGSARQEIKKLKITTKRNNNKTQN